MLQIVTETDIQKFYDDLESMKLLRPHAVMKAASGLASGVVSEYLNRKKKPSKAFIKAFYEKVFDSSTNVLNEEQTPYIKKRLDLKNQQKEQTLMYYEIGAHAGLQHGADILPVKKAEGRLHIGDLFKGSDYAIRISGNSMTPSYPPGSIIGIREIPDKLITPGSVYVIEKESDLWIKRLFYKDDDANSGLFECVSDIQCEVKQEQGPENYIIHHST